MENSINALVMDKMTHNKIGFGGGCHWCTEAVFFSLKGVQQVEQGWIASQPPNEAFSEAVIVTYDPAIITLAALVTIHLHTHASTSNHSMRYKYRSAVYWFNEEEETITKEIIAGLQSEFIAPIITKVLPFAEFRSSLPDHLNYFYSNPNKPFCTLYIHPKLELLRRKFSHLT
jgi:peptide-methionine (S)-S-oxide reductase